MILQLQGRKLDIQCSKGWLQYGDALCAILFLPESAVYYIDFQFCTTMKLDGSTLAGERTVPCLVVGLMET